MTDVGHVPTVDPMRQRLLVIGATEMREASFVTWQRMGLDVVLVDGRARSRYERLAQEFHALDPRDDSADLDRIRQIARTCQGVTTLADDSQLVASRLSDELGLAGIPPEITAVARSKVAMREVVEKAGLHGPRWSVVENEAGIDAFFGGDAFPAVLKPVDATGGAGVVKVGSRDEATSTWPVVRMLSASRSCLIEEAVGGPEVCVEAMITAGELAFCSVLEASHLDTPGCVCVAAWYSTVQPLREAASEQVRRLVETLGLRDGLIHAEFKMNGSTWTLLDLALRPGGGLVPELTRVANGADFYAAQALLALGRQSELTTAIGVPTAPYAAARYLVAEGEVKRFLPPRELLAGLPAVSTVVQQVHPGQRIRTPLSDGARSGYAYGWAEDPHDLDAQLHSALDRLCSGIGLTMLGRAPAYRNLAGVPG